jgi:hypothetical protein
MKKERKKQTNTLKEKLVIWFKQPENILLILILIGVTIVGIIDDNLEIIIIVYIGAFLYGMLFGLFFYIKDKFFK